MRLVIFTEQVLKEFPRELTREYPAVSCTKRMSKGMAIKVPELKSRISSAVIL